MPPPHFLFSCLLLSSTKHEQNCVYYYNVHEYRRYIIRIEILFTNIHSSTLFQRSYILYENNEKTNTIRFTYSHVLNVFFFCDVLCSRLKTALN